MESIDENKISHVSPQNLKQPQKLIYISILVVVLVVIISIVFYFFNKKSVSQKNQPATIVNKNISPTTKILTSPSNKSKKIYFGTSLNNKYSLVDVDNNETKEFIPSGYTIISQHNYDIFPDYFILKKGNDLFSFNFKTQTLNNVFDQSSVLKIKDNETIIVISSITEKNKFYFVIYEYDPNKEEPNNLINTRYYLFDALSNRLERAENVDLKNCNKYDSKNKRFFTWTCGEGTGSTIPLFVRDLNGKNSREIVSMQDYELEETDLSSQVSVQYNNGIFMISEKNNLSKIIIVDPLPIEPKKDVYIVSDKVKVQLKDVYPFSEVIDKINSTIVIGGNNFILLLKYDSKKQIVKSKYLYDKEIYANAIFQYNGRIFYLAKGVLKIINLTSWQIDKSIPLKKAMGEITLISLTD